MFVSVYYKLGLFNVDVRIIFVRIYMNVDTLCVNQESIP